MNGMYLLFKGAARKDKSFDEGGIAKIPPFFLPLHSLIKCSIASIVLT